MAIRNALSKLTSMLFLSWVTMQLQVQAQTQPEPLAKPATENEKFEFDCDAPAGHFSDWNRVISGKQIEITGSLTIHEVRNDPHWNPSAGVRVKQDGKQASYGLLIMGLKKDATSSAIPALGVYLSNGKEFDKQQPFAYLPISKEAKNFRVSMDNEGNVEVQYGDKSAKAQFPAGKLANLNFSCSTVDSSFSAVNVNIQKE